MRHPVLIISSGPSTSLPRLRASRCSSTAKGCPSRTSRTMWTSTSRWREVSSLCRKASFLYDLYRSIALVRFHKNMKTQNATINILLKMHRKKETQRIRHPMLISPKYYDRLSQGPVTRALKRSDWPVTGVFRR